MVEGTTVYVRSSVLENFADENDILDTNKIAEHIMNINGLNEIYKLKVINDTHFTSSLFINESALYRPEYKDDSILIKMELAEILNETSIESEALFVTITKLLTLFKKGDYQNAPAIEHRLKSCQGEINKIEKQLDDYKKLSPSAKKTVDTTHVLQMVCKSVVTLVGTLVLSFIFKNVKVNKKAGGAASGFFKIIDPGDKKLKVGNKIVGMDAVDNAVYVVKSGADISSNSNYEKYLNKYLSSLKEVEQYLEGAVKKAKITDSAREQKAKEAAKNESLNIGDSIMRIMNETPLDESCYGDAKNESFFFE